MPDTKTPPAADNGAATSKAGTFFKKHKTAFIVGGIVLALVIAWWLFGSGGNSSQQTATSGSADPNAQGDIASELASIPSGPTGPAGPTGATGAQGAKGATGKAGKTPDLWDIAKEALIGQGNKNPSSSEIWHERKKLFGIGAKTPAKKSGPVHKATPAVSVPHMNRVSFTTAQPGDTMASIAARNGMSSSALAAKNTTIATVHAGTRVRVK